MFGAHQNTCHLMDSPSRRMLLIVSISRNRLSAVTATYDVTLPEAGCICTVTKLTFCHHARVNSFR